YTPILLDGLKERGVKATFFLMGQNIEGNEEIVKRMSDEGHLIGNHTYSHVQLTAVSEAEALAEVEKDSRLIESITGETVAYIRPPYGSVTESLTEKLNLRIVLWDIDPRDWESQNTSLVVKHILNHIKDGEIILLHDIFRSSVEAALQVIDELTAQGYEFVRVDELGAYE
ncbi:MAG: polysaccharide deacetylase family protein, partial [Lachnospiraceae bacterium]|nr:polysaccharide deacetylase family protein [Lachnospiraceae bacterium]